VLKATRLAICSRAVTAANDIRDSAKADGGADNATAQSDTTKSTAKAKKDHPEAPDTVIGMQDERGGKGR
jgi:hypothetical protein